MKLCETVFAFHHNPTATSGSEGTRRSNAPCSTANPMSNASHGECRRMPSPAAVRNRAASVCVATRPITMSSPGFIVTETKLASIVSSLDCCQGKQTFHRRDCLCLRRLFGWLVQEFDELIDRRVIAHP